MLRLRIQQLPMFLRKARRTPGKRAVISIEKEEGPEIVAKPRIFILLLLGVRIRGTLGDIDPLNKVPI